MLTFFLEIKNVPICFADVRTAAKFPKGRAQLQRTEVMDLRVRCPALLVILGASANQPLENRFW